MNGKRIRVWDLPTRVFHWVLVVAVVAAVVTGQLGGNLMDWHGRIGLGIVGLLAFRIAWGVGGSTYARFRQFLPTPASVKAYLAGRWYGPGHNPLGALSVFGLLALLTAQVTTGLFANDDITFNGPLFDLVAKATSNRLTGIHEVLANVLIALVALHVGAIAFYARVRKDNLVRPMLTGWKEVGAQGAAEHARGGGLVAFVVAVAIAAAAVYGAGGTWMPPPPTAGETPDW